MSAHSVAATSSRGCFSNKCSAALKVLKCSGPAVSFQAVCMCCKGQTYFKQLLRFTLDVLAVCVKIQRIRFEPHPNGADRSGLSQPGTVIDKSQVSLKGTSGPTRFVVLKDEANHTVDDFQNIANIICSGFQIATKSAGIATLTYYANQFSTWANK
ncbi:hypothetical protein PPACK8108_LOCUS25834 [Phakopsora pachyrhizi]|uniref:Piwi domain-containing protein n=1 Tax=Phakopsora pachyrhizi TaxID=170000 RepID=A0AAV0BVW4_PHAPC|nr:hypothetical protein PPACK8108_LOCUS25834 [Phakopsora pachyrhizi]